MESWSRRGVCAGSWLVEVGVWRWSWRCGLRWSRSSTADRAAGTRGAGDGVGLGDWSGCGIFVRHDSCRCVRALASLECVRHATDREVDTQAHAARTRTTRDSCLACGTEMCQTLTPLHQTTPNSTSRHIRYASSFPRRVFACACEGPSCRSTHPEKTDK